MKVMAYYMLHYGKEYLNFSMKSIYPYVDEIVILYTSKPSHGTQGILNNPDTRDQLRDAVYDPDNKCQWIDGYWNNETAHRTQAMAECKARGADMVVVADYDEVWDGKQLEYILDMAAKNMTFRTNIMMQHLWKGFDLICKDQHRQGRIFNLNCENNHEVIVVKDDTPACYHFGYAISNELMEYKLGIHGHISEFRTDWLRQNYLADKDKDVHPVCIDMWNPEPFDKNLLPKVMKDHALWQS